MPDRYYSVRFKEADLAPERVRAAKVEVHGEHLVFLSSTGELSALFLRDVILDWEPLDE